MFGEYYSTFSDPIYIKWRDEHDTNRSETLQELNPRTDELIALTDHLLLLNAELGTMYAILLSLEMYCVNVLLIRDHDQEAMHEEYWRRNFGDMEAHAEWVKQQEADWAKPSNATPKDWADAKTLARSFWEEAPILAEEHGLAEEKWRAERSKYEYTFGPLLGTKTDGHIELQGILKYLVIDLSYKVAKRLGALAPGGERDLKSWMEEMKLMLSYSKRRRVVNMGTSCELSERMVKVIWECKKDEGTERWKAYWRTSGSASRVVDTPDGWMMVPMKLEKL